MSTTRISKERVIKEYVPATRCDICRKVYENEPFRSGMVPQTAKGSGKLEYHRPLPVNDAWGQSLNPIATLDICPDCAGVLWDFIQERVQPDPDAKPPPPPRPPPPAPLTAPQLRYQHYSQNRHVDRCGNEYVMATHSAPARVCVWHMGHGGMCDDQIPPVCTGAR